MAKLKLGDIHGRMVISIYYWASQLLGKNPSGTENPRSNAELWEIPMGVVISIYYWAIYYWARIDCEVGRL